MAAGRSIRTAARSERLASQLAALLVEARGARPRAKVAAAAGVAPSTLADVETANANPTLAYVEQLGALYGVRFDLVVAGD